jgi:hypothetical protein
VTFSKILAFEGTIRKFLNMVAVHIEGSMHPPICLFETLFRVSVPVKLLFCACLLGMSTILKRKHI